MKRLLSILLGFLFIGQASFAQDATMDLQIRPRYEFRNGYKTLQSAADDPASFVSQRSRVGFNYRENRLNLRLSLQHVGNWGEKAGGTEAIGVFEAYGNFDFSDKVGIQAGRQVLSYDNERIFGESNWTQTARSHDALLIKIRPGKQQKLHVGLTYNTDAESLTKMPYRKDNYKLMEYLWYNHQLDKLGISLLFANVGYEQEREEEHLKNVHQQTLGTYLKWTNDRYTADASFYRQSGKRADDKLNAFYAGANFVYRFSPLWDGGLGFEYLSGHDESVQDGTNRAFIPLFGTNHAFNGFMDYFYVGNHQNSVGLKDLYAKLTFVKSPYLLQLSPHVFYAAATMLDGNQHAMDPYLGTEIDLSAGYQLQHNLSLQLGYSQMFTSSSLGELKGGDHALGQHWAWVSLTFSPKFSLFRN